MTEVAWAFVLVLGALANLIIVISLATDTKNAERKAGRLNDENIALKARLARFERFDRDGDGFPGGSKAG